jgi:squalene-hopene/tetraprenyl-beta-curcumene cyclase
MQMRSGSKVVGLLLAAVLFCWGLGIEATVAQDKPPEKPKPPQYDFEKQSISGATASEPVLKEFSFDKAVSYIETGNALWWKKRNCVACHTSGAYGVMRPALSTYLGKPDPAIRKLLVADLAKTKQMKLENLRSGLRPTQVAYLAGSLAEWDKHVTGKLSPETDEALRLMLRLQSKNGAFNNIGCWPPFESSEYHGTTVAAMAVQAAPGWLENLKDSDLIARVARTHNYLKTTRPPHDYGKVLLLWTSTQVPGLIGSKQKKKLIKTLLKHQQDDGGWSIRTFATPETWGDGSRAQKLKDELEFANPPSDGHQTGLVLMVLRDAGVSARKKSIRKGVKWLLKNQRQSGRWWTRSLNTDKYHFITFSGSCYPLLALGKCGVLPTRLEVTRAP